MADFSIDFSTLAEQTKWGKEALKSALLANINDGIKNELMLRELPSSLDALMTLCIWVDDRVCAHQSAHTRSGHEPLGFHGTSTTASGLRDSDTFPNLFHFPSRAITRRGFVFFSFTAPLTPLVLDHPWLVLHNPHIDWGKR